MVAVRLQPMTEEEFAGYRAESIPSYAADVGRADGTPEAESMQRALESYERILPKGLATPGHTVSWVLDATTGERVGHLWLFHDPTAPKSFVYDILILPTFRRRGYAEATLAQAESAGRAHGATRLELHVFGHNTGATALYEKLGFTTTHRMMSKPL
ncbi:MAG TPA: GNAT family N-acetyltransferase [Thermoplasmata archaeon]|nr:GNAT family N-acetyltransferase [Thermoplasmata archaeon]